MRLKSLIATGITLAAFAPSARAEPATWVIDPDHTVIAFTVMHAGYARVLGRFGEVAGSFTYDPETRALGAVEVRIAAQSVDTFHEARDEHVRSADFLDAVSHPDITFIAEGGTPTSETSGTVTGDLSIRGVTQPVTLKVDLNQIAPYPCCHGKETIGISASATLLRSAFGSTYALPVFVGDEVAVTIEFEANRQE
ncbi:YceI family protein [Sulfitobacter sp. LCG007]